ncbi:hypothetical protein BSKO_07980 [Bryopsis sp. KO-2023]|nr:hypothetical protein BSKO_07980 [Bryopsis sp. KO-2023]
MESFGSILTKGSSAPPLFGRSALAARSHNAKPERSPSRLGKPWVGSAATADVASTSQVVEDFEKYTVGTYVRPDVVFTHGAGCKLYDTAGGEYLDFSGGIAVNALGHSDPRWVNAVVNQASKLTHTSNLFHTLPAVELAKKLVENSFADKVFFCNSGTEANEAAIKFARKWARVNAGVDPQDGNGDPPFECVSFSAGFHGRTMGALALTAKQQYQIPFGPMMPGQRYAEWGNLESAKEAIQAGRTCAVFVEPVQGEGGVNSATKEFLAGLRELCDAAGCLLVFDEVQCGLGRTGTLWAHQNFGVTPDIMTLAKPLAGGLPIGAVLVTDAVNAVMAPGDHGSTFAGGPLVCGAACTVFDIVSEPEFLADVASKGEYLREKLRGALPSKHVVEVRGMGLLVGVQLDCAGGKVVGRALEKGLIAITAGKGDVVRLVPPLVVDRGEIDRCCEILAESFSVLDE